MNQENPATNDYLQELGIPIETVLDENVLTVQTAQNVRFRPVQVPGSSKTYGYSFGEVDKFIKSIVIPSLKWFQDALHSRDLNVYQLVTLLDEKTVLTTQLEKEVASAQMNYELQKGLSASENDEEVVGLVAQLKEAHQRIRDLEKKNEPGFPGLNSTGTENDTNQLQTDYETLLKSYEELETYAEQLRQMLESGQLAPETPVTSDPELASRVQELEQQNSELNEYAQQVTQQYELLSNQYTEDVNSLQTQLASSNSPTVVAEVDNSRVQELEQQNSELNEYAQQVTQQYELLSKQYTEDVASLQAQIAGTAPNSQLEHQEQTIISLQNRIGELEAQAQAVDAAAVNASNYAEVGQLRVDLEAATAKIARLEDYIEELEEELPDHQKQDEVKPVATDTSFFFDETPDPDLLEGIDVNNLPRGITLDDL